MAADEDILASHGYLPEHLRYYSPREPKQRGLPKEQGQTGHRAMGEEGDTGAAFLWGQSLLDIECFSDVTLLPSGTQMSETAPAIHKDRVL